MNKLKLFIFLILPVVLLQNCKKDSVTATTLSTAPLQALINNVTWLPDTISTSITYNTATKTKVFTCEGTAAQKRINISITINNATDDGNFARGTYTVDATSNLVIKYSIQQKDSDGNYVFVEAGDADPGAGTVSINAVDPTKKQITGTFNIIIRIPVYDDSGNVISINVTTIADGIFNNLPYTYSSN